MKNIDQSPKNTPQWEDLLFLKTLKEATEKIWFESVFEFWKNNKTDGLSESPPSFNEIEQLYLEKNKEMPRFSEKTIEKTWSKLYKDIPFREKRRLLGYSDEQRELDPKIVRSFSDSLRKEINKRIGEHSEEWKFSLSEEGVWNNSIESSFIHYYKKEKKNEMIEFIENIIEEEKETLIKVGTEYWMSFFYEYFLTETIIEEHYDHTKYYDNQRYTYEDTETPFTLSNTPTVSDFESSPSGDFYYPRYLGDMLEQAFYKGCSEGLKQHIIQNKTSYDLQNTDDVILSDIVEDAISSIDFYEFIFDWICEDLSHLRELSSFDLLVECEKTLPSLSTELKNRFRNLLIEQEEDELLKKELFEKEFNSLFNQHRMNKKYVLHVGPTNSGKTYNAIQKLKQSNTGCYLAPLRLLAYEVRDLLVKEGVRCSLLTGEDKQINIGDTHISSTVEMFSHEKNYDLLVIDEAQMISDNDRGHSWLKAMIDNRAKEIHITCAKYAEKIILEILKNQDVEVVHYERQTPLHVVNKEINIFDLEDDVQKGDACIVFSKNKVLATATSLEEKGIKTSVIYGAMPHEVRIQQMNRFINGESDVVVSTDAIGMGLNLPIKRVLFLEVDKFDGYNVRSLNSQEIKQIAGRAGRKGLYEEGFVLFSDNVKRCKMLLEKEDEQIEIITIEPTKKLFDAFSEKSNDFKRFFKIWDAFHIDDVRISKKSLHTEENRLSFIKKMNGFDEFLDENGIFRLYRLLSVPFSSNDMSLFPHYLNWVEQIFSNQPLKPIQVDISSNDFSSLETDYALINLFLSMKHFCGETDTASWERKRILISEKIDNLLSEKDFARRCKHCGDELDWHSEYNICDDCYVPKRSYRHNEYDEFDEFDEFEMF